MEGALIADVPPELAQCEFGCRVRECSHGKSEGCENRIRCMNAELDYRNSASHAPQTPPDIALSYN
jgi:putative ribosome biogenesis GTPase RsgA